jgi:hypothetical protein
MQFVSFASAIALSLCLAPEASAQGGGGRWRRPEEITNRTGAFFVDATGPATEGDKVADLGTIELARTAKSANQMVVLYLVDSGDEQDTRDQFEGALFANDELGIELKFFHCAKIDLAKEPALKTKYTKLAPLFVVFDANGKPAELSMSGYKPSVSGLTKLLEKQATGTVKPSLAGFAKTYGGIIQDLEQVLSKKKQAQQKQAKAGSDQGKRAEADKDVKALEAEEQKILGKEKDLLGKVRLPERDAKAQRLGAPRWGGRGGAGGGAAGGGAPGGGAPGAGGGAGAGGGTGSGRGAAPAGGTNGG